MSKRLKADLGLLMIAIIWGSSFILMKNLLDYTPVFAYLSLRFLIAGIVLVIVFRKRMRNISKATLAMGSCVGFMVFAAMVLQVEGLKYTTASNSGFITGLNVVMVPVISALYLKKNPRWTAVIGVILAAFGLFFITGGINFSFNKGDFLTFLCAIFCALHIIFIDKANGRHDAIQIAAVQVLAATVMFNAVWAFQGFSLPVVNMTLVSTILWTGIGGTSIALLVLTIAQKYTTPTRTALIVTCEPVFAMLFAWIIPGMNGRVEVPGLNTLLGCVLILSGMLLSELPALFLGIFIKENNISVAEHEECLNNESL